MNRDEFNTFTQRLFVQYPATWSWLKANSPDVSGTLESWFRRLGRFSLSDCLNVLETWEASNSEPWKAYDRENVPAVIASVIAKRESDAAKREATDQIAREANAARQRRGSFDLTASFDSGMLQAYKELKPLWDQVCEGELSDSEYQEKKRVILAKMDKVEAIPF